MAGLILTVFKLKLLILFMPEFLTVCVRIMTVYMPELFGRVQAWIFFYCVHYQITDGVLDGIIHSVQSSPNDSFTAGVIGNVKTRIFFSYKLVVDCV
jgi:hypothetical protein